LSLFFFTPPPTTHTSTLSLHDALPILAGADRGDQHEVAFAQAALRQRVAQAQRNRGGGGVAVLVDVDHHLGIIDAKPFLRRADEMEEHTSELQSPCNLVCRLLLEKKKK